VRWSLLFALLLASACASPSVRVELVDGRRVHEELTRNVLSAGELSAPSRALLVRLDSYREFRRRPEIVLGELHAGLKAGDSDRLFALAEASFLHAEQGGDRSWYLASAVYAWAFLFPQDRVRITPTDPRVRLAFDLYNRGIAEGLATPDGREVRIAAGRHELPFGVLDVKFDPVELRWAGYRFEGFAPAAHLEVKGLRNRYRRRGIGAPLAASFGDDPDAPPPPASDRIPDFVKVPVSAVLRLEEPQDDLASGTVHATLELYARDETPFVTIHGREIPLEFETSSSLAYSLHESWFWDFSFAGFRSSDFLPIEVERAPDRLLMLEPYRPGRIPVVLVHGTASSPGTWAELVNEIENDSELGNRYQVWLFVYNTGSPILYSAGLLRQALGATVEELDPRGDDPALQRMVVIGHSQGGLVTKLLVVSSGDDFWHNISDEPLDEKTADPGALALLERSTYFEPAPAVERVVFIATPHRGTHLLGSFRFGGIISWVIKLPANLFKGLVQLGRRDPKSEAVGRLKRLRGLPTSIDDMTPGNPTLRVLRQRPIAPGVSAHSIIAVRGDGAPEDGGDGVVTYSSAHIEGVESELVVRSGHSTQKEPPSIEEVRRILLLHGVVR
jgi:pimeloyl-ACP methyl ester carboxylesterase